MKAPLDFNITCGGTGDIEIVGGAPQCWPFRTLGLVGMVRLKYGKPLPQDLRESISPTVELPEELRTTVPGADVNADVKITLKYERAPKTSVCLVAGKVDSSSLDLSSLEVETRHE
jgi:hypothetical protein